MVWLTFALAGCHPTPDEVHVFQLPDKQGYLISENVHGHGAMSFDYTTVFYAADREIRSDRVIILGGDYLSISGLKRDPNGTAVICIGAGRPDRFKNTIEIGAASSPHLLRFRIAKDCS